MGVILGLAIVSLFLIIIVIKSIIILKRNKPRQKFDETNIFTHQLKNKSPVQCVSSEKIKQLKEKEEQIQKMRAEVINKNVQQNKIKEEKKKENSIILQNVIRAGEVQRGEKEQFNLRKDEESIIKAEEYEKW